MIWYFANLKNHTLFELNDYGEFWKELFINHKKQLSKPRFLKKEIFKLIRKYCFIYNKKNVEDLSRELVEFMKGCSLDKDIVLFENSYEENPGHFGTISTMAKYYRNFIFLRSCYDDHDGRDLKLNYDRVVAVNATFKHLGPINFRLPIPRIKKLLLFI